MSSSTTTTDAYYDLAKAGYRPCSVQQLPGTKCTYDVMLTPDGRKRVKIIARQEKSDFRYWLGVDHRLLDQIDEIALWTGGYEDYIYFVKAADLKRTWNEHRGVFHFKDNTISFNVTTESQTRAVIEPLKSRGIALEGCRILAAECDHAIGMGWDGELVCDSTPRCFEVDLSERFTFCPRCGRQLR